MRRRVCGGVCRLDHEGPGRHPITTLRSAAQIRVILPGGRGRADGIPGGRAGPFGTANMDSEQSGRRLGWVDRWPGPGRDGPWTCQCRPGSGRRCGLCRSDSDASVHGATCGVRLLMKWELPDRTRVVAARSDRASGGITVSSAAFESFRCRACGQPRDGWPPFLVTGATRTRQARCQPARVHGRSRNPSLSASAEVRASRSLPSCALNRFHNHLKAERGAHKSSARNYRFQPSPFSALGLGQRFTTFMSKFCIRPGTRIAVDCGDIVVVVIPSQHFCCPKSLKYLRPVHIKKRFIITL